MEISVRYRENVAILDVRGEILNDARIEFCQAIRNQVNSGEVKGIIISLEEMPMTDSVTLGILIYPLLECADKHKKMVLLNVSRSPRYLLVVTKTDSLFEKYDNEDKALASVLGFNLVALA